MLVYLQSLDERQRSKVSLRGDDLGIPKVHKGSYQRIVCRLERAAKGSALGTSSQEVFVMNYNCFRYVEHYV